MRQLLTNAIKSITQEIERLTEAREQIRSMIGTSDAVLPVSSLKKYSARKSVEKSALSKKRRGRPAVSEQPREKRADARRTVVARKKAASKKTSSKTF